MPPGVITSTTSSASAEPSSSGMMLVTWRVLEPLPRTICGCAPGGMSLAGCAPPPGAEQTASSSGVSAVDRVAAAGRDVGGPGRPLERAHALADLAEILAVDRELRLARDEHEADLARAGLGGEALVRLQPVEGEAHVAPAGAFRGHLGDEAMGALRPHAQFRHRLPPFSVPWRPALRGPPGQPVALS